MDGNGWVASPTVAEALPLTVLLSKVWTAQVIEIDNAVEAAGAARFGGRFRISLAMWANGLRLISEGGTPAGELRRLARAECNVGGLERWGWINVGTPGRAGEGRRPGYGTRRGLHSDTLLRPTSAGTAARALWPEVVETVEARWQSRFGADVVDTLRRDLAHLTAGMPWAVPEVAPSDGFRTHLVDGDRGHDGDQRPLVVLLGQALTALTVAAEASTRVSLPLAENLLQPLAAQATPVADLPRRTGLSKEAIAMAVGFLARRDLAVVGRDRSASLTAHGAAALADHRCHLANPADHGGLQAALAAVLAQPDALCVGLEPPPRCWRAQRPYLAQTRRLQADPVAALPRHPMVLHRGGWPDGS